MAKYNPKRKGSFEQWAGPDGLKKIANALALKAALFRTWNELAADAGEMPSDQAYEVVLDAGRLEQIGCTTESERLTVAEFRKLPWKQQMETCRLLMGRI